MIGAMALTQGVQDLTRLVIPNRVRTLRLQRVGQSRYTIRSHASCKQALACTLTLLQLSIGDSAETPTPESPNLHTGYLHEFGVPFVGVF